MFVMLSVPNNLAKLFVIRCLDVAIGTISFYICGVLIRDESLKKDILEQTRQLYEQHLLLLRDFTSAPSAVQRIDIDILLQRIKDLKGLCNENHEEVAGTQIIIIKNFLLCIEELAVFCDVSYMNKHKIASTHNKQYFFQKLSLFRATIENTYKKIEKA